MEQTNREIALGILERNISGTDGSLEGQSLSCRIATVYAILALTEAVEKLADNSGERGTYVGPGSTR